MRYLICILVLLFVGCVANFGTGEQNFNFAGSQNAATGEAEVEGEATDGGLMQGSENALETDGNPLSSEPESEPQPDE